MKAKDLAQGKWKSVLAMLGIPEELLDHKHHRCPKGDGRDRFRFADRNGSGNYFCACSKGDKGGIGLLMCCRDLSYVDACKEVERVVGGAVDTVERQKRDPRIALNRVRGLLQPVGFGVARYLRERGLKPAPGLRQARLVAWEDNRKRGPFDTMVALFQRADGTPESYHLTYLDGVAKAPLTVPRKVMPPVTTITGCAIRLYPMQAHIGIAEGIETAIAAHMLHGLPVWSVYSANGVEAFIPPEGSERVTIFGDNDQSWTGQAAAYACAKRLASKGIACEVKVPEAGDWNDELLRRAS